MQDILRSLGDLATASAAVITILTLIALLNKGFHYILAVPKRIRAYFFSPKYIIIPAPDELAKYCIKSFDSHRVTVDEMREEYIHYRLRELRKFRRKSESRISILYLATFITAAFFVSKILHLKIFESGHTPRYFAFLLILPLLAITLQASVSLWVHLYYPHVKSLGSLRRIGAWLLRSF